MNKANIINDDDFQTVEDQVEFYQTHPEAWGEDDFSEKEIDEIADLVNQLFPKALHKS
jgi:uncharacterized protein YecA (UPF0149 family)